MKNKKVLIVIIVLLIILAVCGGAFAYVYFATDLLKSNSQMFSKYGTMLDMELYNFFYDENIKKRVSKMFDIMLQDNIKGRYMKSDGKYYRPEITEGETLIDSQEYFFEESYGKIE